MEFVELKQKSNIEANRKLKKRYATFKKLLQELKQKEIPDEIIKSINHHIDEVNACTEPNKDLPKQLRKSTIRLLRLIEKELKLVPKNLYRSRWMTIGMSMGVAIGAAFSVSMDNSGSIAIGIGIGMVIGLAIGARMDKKAKEEGRQLDLEVNY